MQIRLVQREHSLLKKMPGFGCCYRLVIQVLTLLVKFPLLWICNKIRHQLVLCVRVEMLEPVEHEDQESKLYSSTYYVFVQYCNGLIKLENCIRH